jgi:hypothetical protein
MDKLGFIKVKVLFKKYYKKLKREATNWEEILT